MGKQMAPSAESWAMRPLGNELAEALRAELVGWPGVAARGMMGTLSFFRGKQMLGCYVSRDFVKKPVKPEWVNRPGEPPFVWVRLRLDDKIRALRRAAVRVTGAQQTSDATAREARLGFAGWIEIPLESRASLEEAVRWFGTAYERPPRRKLAKRSTSSRKKKKRSKPRRK